MKQKGLSVKKAGANCIVAMTAKVAQTFNTLKIV